MWFDTGPVCGGCRMLLVISCSVSIDTLGIDSSLIGESVQYSTVGICVSFVGATFYRLCTTFLFTVCVEVVLVSTCLFVLCWFLCKQKLIWVITLRCCCCCR